MLAALLLAGLILGTAPPARAGDLAFGLVLDGHPLSGKRLEQARREAGLPVRLAVFFLQWPGDPQAGEFPLATLEAIHGAGMTPCLTWEPMRLDAGAEQAIPARDILSGRYDPYVRRFAREAARWGRPLLLRFGHEMNLARYHWGTAPEEYGPGSPGLYREMFRHLRRVFQEAGADKVLWVFCPNAESLPHPERDPGAAWNTPSAYYPGDDAVDVLGMDGYNWGTTQTREKNGWDSSFRSFADIFGPVHAELRSLAPSKPLLVFETACAVRGGDKGRWIMEALETAREWGLAGLCWFDVDKEVDWRFRTGLDGETIRNIQERLGRSKAGEGWLGLKRE